MATPENVEQLMKERARFVSFVSARLGDRAAAEDIVQTAAAQALADPRDLHGQELSRWFYRVLRNAIVDRYRRERAQTAGLQRWQRDPTAHAVEGSMRRLCTCVKGALERLDPKLRAALEAVEVRGLPPRLFAAEAAISTGNAAVRVHRARRRLAEELRGICGTCTLDACSDCDCGHSTAL